MSDRGIVQSDCIIEVHSDIIEAARDESHDGDEPGGGAGSALRHAKPFIKSVGDLGDLIQFLIVDCDSDAARFLWDAHEGTGPR